MQEIGDQGTGGETGRDGGNVGESAGAGVEVDLLGVFGVLGVDFSIGL